MLVSVSDTDGAGARAMLRRLALMGERVCIMPAGVEARAWHAMVAAHHDGIGTVYVEGRSDPMHTAYKLFVLCSHQNTLDQWAIAFDMMERGMRVAVV